jgi:hypothetical protein
MTAGRITREDDIRVRNARAKMIEDGTPLPINRYHMDTLAKQAEVEAREKAQATPRKRRTRKS